MPAPAPTPTVTARAPTAPDTAAVGEPDQRGRILDVALRLLADHGPAGMSMRTLARTCELNVATLYHYFPSKDVLVASAIERGSVEGLLRAPPPVARSGSVTERLERLFETLAMQMFENDDLWRVLIAEALHGDDDTLSTVLSVSGTFDEVLRRWLAELLPDAPEVATPAAVATTRHALYGMLILLLVQPERRDEALARGVRDLVAVLTRNYPPAVPGAIDSGEVS